MPELVLPLFSLIHKILGGKANSLDPNQHNYANSADSGYAAAEAV